jgi:hypothetical protein
MYTRREPWRGIASLSLVNKGTVQLNKGENFSSFERVFKNISIAKFV